MTQFYTQFTTAGAVTDSKRAKYSNPTKTQNICMYANQQGKKRSTKQFQKTSVTHQAICQLSLTTKGLT